MKCGNCKKSISSHQTSYQIDFSEEELNLMANDDVFCNGRCLESFLILKRLEKKSSKKINLSDKSFKELNQFDFGDGNELIVGIQQLNNYLWVHTQDRQYFIDLQGKILMSK